MVIDETKKQVNRMMNLSKGILIQVYDTKLSAWYTVCPVTAATNLAEDRRNEICALYTHAHEQALADYLEEKEILYLISSLQSAKDQPYEETYFLLNDISMHLRVPSCRKDAPT